MKNPISVPEEHIKHININGMTGRMIHIPNANAKKVIFYIHGMHSSAERHYSLCEYLADFGEVYAPDLPGFGGMTSFYKIGLKPTYDSYADYLYSVMKSIKLRPNQQLCFVGLSYGAQLMTRMLQKYPELTSNTQVVSLIGCGAGTDIKPRRVFKALVIPILHLGASRITYRLLDLLVYNPISSRIILAILVFTSAKARRDSDNHRMDIYRMEYSLWQGDDTRTHANVALSMFNDDLRKYSKVKIKAKLHNVISAEDQYFDNEKVAQTFGDLYQKYESATVSLKAHAPSLVAGKDGIAAIFPEKTRKLLKS